MIHVSQEREVFVAYALRMIKDNRTDQKIWCMAFWTNSIDDRFSVLTQILSVKRTRYKWDQTSYTVYTHVSIFWTPAHTGDGFCCCLKLKRLAKVHLWKLNYVALSITRLYLFYGQEDIKIHSQPSVWTRTPSCNKLCKVASTRHSHCLWRNPGDLLNKLHEILITEPFLPDTYLSLYVNVLLGWLSVQK